MLFGPQIGDTKGSYGGGTGGYTRNMSAYLTGFEDRDFAFTPCFHTIRQQGFSIWNSFPVRFLRDMGRIVRGLIATRPRIVHIMAQYRTAAPRELFCAWLARLAGRHVFYEIKAGEFEHRYVEGSALYRWMIRRTLGAAHRIGIEGQRYQRFLETEFNRSAVYLPNICLDSEIPAITAPRFQNDVLKVMFVGYCYEGKGVFELVEGCIAAAGQGVRLELILAGHHSDPFAEFLATQTPPEGLTITAPGRVEYTDVLAGLQGVDIFCLPTRHKGEGHNNSVNEAMMCGCLVLCTRHGFLGDILNEDVAVFLENLTGPAIAARLGEIDADRPGSIERAARGRAHFEDNFTSRVVFARLAETYRDMTGGT